MKILTFFLALIFIPATIFAQSNVPADTIQVFSKLNYYTTEHNATVVALLPAGDFQNVKLELYNGKKQVAFNSHIVNSRVEANVALKDVGKADYPYTLLQNKKVLKKGKLQLVKLAPKANEVKINLLTGGLVVDGTPFVPFGFYCGPVGKLPDQEVLHGFNMIGPYQSNLPDGLVERKAYMDRCAAIGIKVQYGVNSLVGFGHNGDKGLDKTEAEKFELLKQEVLAFKDHPALLSWYINDEPDGQGRPPEVLEKAYNFIKQLDPYHPISIVFMMPSKIDQFKNTMDIAMTDPYPIPGPVDKIIEDVSTLKIKLNHQRPVWLVPQAFGGQEMWPREPTGKEIRVMTYLGLLTGATGIQYYVHAPSNQNPQSVSAWSACSDIAVEVGQMTPFLLSEEKAPAVKTNNPALTAKAYWHQNHLLLVVANKENKPTQFDLNFSAPAAKLKSKASLWFENRDIAVSNNQINDFIDAYSTRVYLISPEQVDTKLSVPGNLTFNPDFEKVPSPGLVAGSNANVKGNEQTDPAATVFADTRQHLQGLFSLRFITPADSAGTGIRLTPFVVSAGNSYSASVWAKAKHAVKMPTFNLSIKEMGINKSYTLDTTWREYSFTFEPKVSSTNTLLSLSLATKGTAWFDMLQVNADPVISYEITPDKKAKVSLVSYTSNSALKYQVGLQEKLTNYTKPLIVSSPQTITAQLYVDGIKAGQTQKFIPVNKALGMPVKLITPAAPQYPAKGSVSITDGLMASTAFKDPNWLGFIGEEVIVQVDLQKPTPVNKISLKILCDANSGIFLPKDVTFLTSDDGINFTHAGTLENKEGSIRGEPYLKMFTVSPAQKQARYIQVKATSVGKIPAEGYLFPGTHPWIFIDELLVE